MEVYLDLLPGDPADEPTLLLRERSVDLLVPRQLPWDAVRDAVVPAVSRAFGETPGVLAEEVAAALRGSGHRVRVVVADGLALRHGCGREYALRAWDELPGMPMPDGQGGVLELKRCGCGSHVTLAGVAVGHAT